MGGWVGGLIGRQAGRQTDRQTLFAKVTILNYKRNPSVTFLSNSGKIIKK